MMELVTGGSGSGKSAYAEEVICRLHRETCRRENGGKDIPLYYIATMFPYGSETEKKIARHRTMRSGKGFKTIECYTDLEGKVRQDSQAGQIIIEKSCALLECMSNLTANEMYMDEGAKEFTVTAVETGIKLLKQRCSHLVVVTNEVFSESGPDTPEMELYKQNLGQINQMLGAMSDRVTEVVYGVPLTVKPENMAEGTEMERERFHIIIGGAYQGKTAWARKKYPEIIWTDGEICNLDGFRDCRGITRLHCLIRRWMKAGRDRDDLIRLLKGKRDRVIISDELGCGLVPTGFFDREYRENVGRIMTELVRAADRADRILCGIPVRIK